MKITFITTGDIQNIATSKRAFGMAEPLTRLGYDVSIIVERTPNNQERMKQEASCAQALWFKSCSAIQEVRRKKKILHKLKPDIIYISALGVRNLAWSWGLAKESHYLVEHSELASSIKNQSLLRRILSLSFEKMSLVLFEGHIVASRYLEQYINNNLSKFHIKRCVHYSPYAYSSNILKPKLKITKELCKKIGDRKTLVYMGTLSKNYGILDIIEAVNLLREEMPDLILFVLGKGRDAVVAKERVNKLNLQHYIEFEGYVPDTAMPSYLELADVFIAPLYDSVQDKARCPSKLFLYLPFNRPIVTTKLGEANALLGDYEFYFQPANVNDMSKVIKNALNVKDNWLAPWDIEAHSWNQRAIDLNVWLLSFLDTK